MAEALIIITIIAVLVGVPLTIGILVLSLRGLRCRVQSLESRVTRLQDELRRHGSTVSAPASEPSGMEEALRPPVVDIPARAYPTPPVEMPPHLKPPPMIVAVPAAGESHREKVPEPGDIVPAANGEINWERFLGVKLFAWLGGLALFMGVAFFLKYAFEHNLIAPAVRVAMGIVFGLGLIGVGALVHRRDYAVTAHTLMATGLVVLYAVSFTARSLYHLINTPVLFATLCLITAGAFILSIRFNAKVIAILGVLGGFLAPQIVGGKNPNAYVLFTYITFLNAGLFAIGRRQGWTILVPLGVVATILTELLWIGVALNPGNALGTVLMVGVLNALFVGIFWREAEGSQEQMLPAIAHALATFMVAFSVLHLQSPLPRPLLAIAAIFLGNLALLALYMRKQALVPLILGGACSGVLILHWILSRSAPAPAIGMLSAFVVHCVLNVAVPAALRGFPGPAVSLGVVPFILLAIYLCLRKVENYSLAFAFLGLVSVLTVVASYCSRQWRFLLIALVGAVLGQNAWLAGNLSAAPDLGRGLWSLGFFLAFTTLPFAIRRRIADGEWLPWRVSGLAGPLHFTLIYHAVERYAPDFSMPGLIPAVLAVPAVIALVVTRAQSVDEHRLRFTAIYGASILFFVTVIFPVQFDREWLTIGWAFEGAALLWLYRWVPIAWLPKMATSVLLVAFARLALNPDVLSYHQRSDTPILNWYLYGYGLVAFAHFLAARLAGEERIFGRPIRGIFGACGVILLFLLMNIEIADFYATGPFLAFDFTGNFARDMTYSIAWAAFALVLLGTGAVRAIRPIRIAGIALMIVTLIKLFLHDLSNLDQLYRIGAFVGVAVILIFASWVYQRFVRPSTRGPVGSP